MCREWSFPPGSLPGRESRCLYYLLYAWSCHVSVTLEKAIGHGRDTTLLSIYWTSSLTLLWPDDGPHSPIYLYLHLQRRPYLRTFDGSVTKHLSTHQPFLVFKIVVGSWLCRSPSPPQVVFIRYFPPSHLALVFIHWDLKSSCAVQIFRCISSLRYNGQ